MKISFVRIENDKLPEPYKGLTTNILYLTETGHVYPEGSDRPIDIFDPTIIEKLSDNPRTTFEERAKVELDDVDSELVIDYIRKHKDLLSHVKLVRYASIKSISETTGYPRDYTKETIDILVKLGVLTKYSTVYKITDKLFEIVNFELENNI
jgi:hypothetical protein